MFLIYLISVLIFCDKNVTENCFPVSTFSCLRSKVGES